MSAAAPGGPSVHVVLLNWRTAEMTLRAMHAARAAMAGIAGAVTIVDNDSRDGSEEALRDGVAGLTGHPAVRVVQSGRNGGFGAGNNVGIRMTLPDGTRPDYVFLQNSDAFPEADAIAVLRDHMEAHPKAGFAGSRIFGEDGAHHQTAFRFPSPAGEIEGAARTGPVTKLLKSSVVPLKPQLDAPSTPDWVAGAALMMRRTMLEQIGDFDETFFLYYEETDLCRRGADAGWEVHYVPASRVMHIGSVSTGMKTWTRIPDYWFASREHYFRKHHGRAGALAATAGQLLGSGIWRARCLVSRRPVEDPPGMLRGFLRHTFDRSPS